MLTVTSDPVWLTIVSWEKRVTAVAPRMDAHYSKALSLFAP